MWRIGELKIRGKNAFKLNYWKTVLVSLIVLILIGGTAGGSAAGAGPAAGIGSVPNIMIGSSEDADDAVENAGDAESIKIDDHSISVDGNTVTIDGETVHIEGVDGEAAEIIGDTVNVASVAALAAIAIIAIIIALIVVAVVIVIDAFVCNPLEVGSSRFFVRNLNTKAEAKELAYGYDNGYLNVVKTLFFKDLYTFLWSLLFIIPGIVKSYEYRMMPYILADHPDMPCKEVFAKSREMMRGNKWHAFLLDLSFIGWNILSALTLGILGVFYVNPYKNMTNAALYERLEYGHIESETV